MEAIGLKGFLMKPVSRFKLSEMIRTVLDKDKKDVAKNPNSFS
jgi:hypothetical protein